MSVPSGISITEITNTIDRVVKNLSYKFRFSYYDQDDIAQQGRMIAWSGIVHNYTEGRPLENFLRVHVRNRLINFKRDHSKKIMTDNVEVDIPEDGKGEEEIERGEVAKLIDERLPIQYRADYLKIKAGMTLPKYKRERLLQVLREILNEE